MPNFILRGTLTGTANDDTLSGGTGTEVLNSFAGNDVFVASAGPDTVDGGVGADVYDTNTLSLRPTISTWTLQMVPRVPLDLHHHRKYRRWP